MHENRYEPVFAVFQGTKNWHNDYGQGFDIFEAYIGSSQEFIIYWDGSPVDPSFPFTGKVDDFAISAFMSSTQLLDETCLADLSNLRDQEYDYIETNASMQILTQDT